jgi:DNA-binding GntR family transcriptional regulator
MPTSGEADPEVFGAAPRLHQRILEILRDRIATGEVEAGSRLVESRLAREFGVSRAPVRQALAELRRQGVVSRQERGYLVTDRPLPEPARPPTGRARREQLTAVPSWQRYYGAVEDSITSRIAFGSWRVLETALAQHFGFSRTVARELLARLQQAGLVRNESGRWLAPMLSDRRVEELYALRAILEPAALVEAAPLLPPGLLARMDTALGAALAAEPQPDGDVLDRLEHEMHVELLAPCPNETLLAALAQHQSLLAAHRFFYRWTARMYPREPFLAEHLEIVGRLSRGDVDGAAAGLREHLLASRSRAVERIGQVRGLVVHEPLAYLERLPE